MIGESQSAQANIQFYFKRKHRKCQMIKVEKINGNLHVEMVGGAMELGAELFEATKAFYDTVAKKR